MHTKEQLVRKREIELDLAYRTRKAEELIYEYSIWKQRRLSVRKRPSIYSER